MISDLSYLIPKPISGILSNHYRDPNQITEPTTTFSSPTVFFILRHMYMTSLQSAILNSQGTSLVKFIRVL